MNINIKSLLAHANVNGLLVFATCMCLFVGRATAQKEIYSQDFNGTSTWSKFVSDSARKVSVTNGRFRIEYLDTSKFVIYTDAVEIDFAKNWSMQATVRLEEGDNTHGAGLTFAAADDENRYEFIITSDGYYRISRRIEGEYSEWVDWKANSAIKIGAQDNVLLVKKVNDAMTFFINNKPVYSLTASFFNTYGNRLGFVVHKKRAMSADDLQIKQWEPDAVKSIPDATSSRTLVNLGRAINDISSDLVDCISADGSVLLFSRTDHPENIPPTDKRDVWMSTRNDDGSWAKAVNLGKPVNNSGQNFAITISPDLNTLVLQNQYDMRGEPAGPGLSMTNRTSSGWAIPTNIQIEDLVNEGEFTSSHVSPDGLVIVTSVQIKSGYGALDMYACFRKEDGTWSAPVNMGPTLNTQGTEYGAFIAGDGRTLYFSSNGHPGYGGVDIFVTRRLDNTWTKWTTPLNLGKGINSDGHDNFFYVPAKGDSAYFSSTNNAIGRDDIFSVALPQSAKPEPVILVRGRVLHALTKQPLEASVRYEVLPGGRQAGLARSNPSTGKYAVALPAGALYGVLADAPGYYPLSEQFSTKELKKYVVVERDLFLVPIADGAIVRLNNVFFDFGKSALREESFPELDRLAVFLKANPAMSIELGGHTDNVGEDATNKALSQDRVNSVLAYLTSKSIPAAKLRAKGYGESKPVATNDTEEGRQQNRRVEFTILKR